MMRRLLVLLGFVLGCGKSPAEVSTPAYSGIVGTYVLASVNGQSMPYSPVAGVTYIRGTLTLRSDSTFAEVQVIQYFQVTSTEQRYGAFSLLGDSVVFTFSGYSAPFTMRWAQDTLMAQWNEGLFVYRR